MTATERQFKGKSDEYLSMDDIEVYGEIIDKLSFKEALEQKEPILSDYKIVTTLITKTEIEELINENNFVKSDGTNWSVEGDASTFAALIALRKIIRERNLNHAISFHSNIKRSKDFQNLNAELSKADNSFEKLSSFHVSGKDSTGIRAAELERFIDSSPSLITNARCLTEGVDVPAIDAVLFADPKQSKIDIVQAAGRALRKFKGKKFGYIIVPVVLDEGDENSINETYKQIITVISALGMNDERIIDQYSVIANGSQVQDPIVEMEFPEIIRFEFKELISNIEILIWDRLSFGWTKGLEKLTKYVEDYGDARVPMRYKDKYGFNLGSWVNHRINDYRKGILSKDRIQKLESFEGWVWDRVEANFQKGLKQLRKYVQENDNARVPSRFEDKDGFHLGRWTSSCRRSYKNKTISLNHIKQLESVDGWVWNILEAKFEEGLERLNKYVDEYGNARVPNNFIDKNDFELGHWVVTRRIMHKKGNLSSVHTKKLESVDGWVWNIFEAEFEDGLEQLKKYVEEYDDANVPIKYLDKDNFKLGVWCSNIRRQFKKGNLPLKKIKKLETFKGWVWDRSVSVVRFKEGLKQLSKYVQENGNARVPGKYESKNGFRLGSWVSKRRIEFRQNLLSQDRIQKLESFEGWVWNPSEEKLNGIRQLNKYVQENGNARPSARYIDKDGFNLGRWVSWTRTRYAKKELSSDLIKKLESFKGWVWTRQEADYKNGIEQLSKYVQENGNARVPARFSYKNRFFLGSWVRHKKDEYRKGILPKSQIKELESFDGWVWNLYDANFQKGLEQLSKYVQENGDTKVPAGFVDNEGFNLGKWVSKRRAEYRNKKLLSNRIQQLESVNGWVWK